MTETPPIRLTIPPERSGERLDRALATELAGSESRSSIQKLIRDGHILLNGRPARVATEVAEGDEILMSKPEPVAPEIQPQDVAFGLVFEDDHLAVIDKPAGMTTHPAPGSPDGTLVNGLLYRIRNLSGIGGVLRPGIVHRLDKGTTGLLVVAKHDEAHRRLAAQLEARTLKRIYEAVVWGEVMEEQFVIEAPIARHARDRKRMGIVEGGKAARTWGRVRFATPLASHLDLQLDTGRTHQIRVHMQHRHHPLVGDAMYGGRRRAIRTADPAVRRDADLLVREIDRPALHARALRFLHPESGEPLSFESPLPADFRRVLDFIELRRSR
ncbi:MAG: pseudouridine synthase [Gemmatimonadota bacterium]|nr:MAG: pseudouridine synthase [Gemmatimonadota bacterium]